MKIIRPNPNALDHKKVAEQFGMELEYIGWFPVGKQPHGKAVYKILSPKDDREFFVLDLNFKENKVFKQTATKEIIASYAKVNALHCKVCDKVIYSTDVHDWRRCGCNEEKHCFVDGGFDYFRYGGDFELFEVGQLDLIKGVFKVKKEDKNGKD